MAYGEFWRIRPAADIGPISEGARYWGMNRRSCPAAARYSKRSFRFSTSTFLMGGLGP